MKTYDHLLIYYFSGTGNALTAANWMKENAVQEQIDTKIYSIEKIDNEIIVPELEGKTLIGFCYPTHGFIAPWLVLKFLWKFPKVKNADVFFVNTRGGFIIYKLPIPGLSGLAQWFSIFLFMLKGFGIKGSLPLDMPHSWTLFFPPVNKSGQTAIVKRCRKIVNKMSLRMFSGKRYFRYSIWVSLPLDILIIPVIPLYMLLGRFMLSKFLFASYNCNTCRICEMNCPVKAITIKDNRPFWKYTCESCMRCMNICPKKAIQSWTTRIALIFYLLSIGGSMFLSNINDNILFLIYSILLSPIYWLVFRILGVRLINIIFTYTSLTKVWGRYLTPGIKVKDFKEN